jgi:hypothetical protein
VFSRGNGRFDSVSLIDNDLHLESPSYLVFTDSSGYLIYTRSNLFGNYYEEFVQVITQTKIARVYHCRFWSSYIWYFNDDEDARSRRIAALLEHLPPAYTDRVLFMQRKIDEILASQKQILVRYGKPNDQVSDEQLSEMYSNHLAKVNAWLDEQTNFSVIYLDYNAMLADPTKYARQVNQFLDNSLNPQEMAGVVDPNLYSQRK